MRPFAHLSAPAAARARGSLPRSLGAGAAVLFATASYGQAQAQRPGPSPDGFAKPFYSCVRNFYVAPNGDDRRLGTASDPWATLQHADHGAGGRQAGDCVNVAPGTYAAGVRITRGGNAASPSGYVVYRCQKLDECKITASGGNAAPAVTLTAEGHGPDYVVIDGFELRAGDQRPYGVGIFVNNNSTGGPRPTPSAHHIWIINNVIHGFGESGIGTNEADWLFLLHNTVSGNSAVTCDAQGSGISIVVAKATPDYIAKEADRTWAPYHQVIAWNVSHDNVITRCGDARSPYNTDGNGIIIDTFNGSGIDDVAYPDQTLVMGNVVYRNGGKGIQVFRSSHVTVANNTAYDNNLDPWNRSVPRGEISNAGGTANTYIGNIAVAIPAISIHDDRCRGAAYGVQPAPCPLMANVAFFGGNAAGVLNSDNLWLRNISFGGTPPWGWGPKGNVMLGQDVMSCNLNKCDVNPFLADPERLNFALTAPSPAIGYGGNADGSAPPAWPDAGACPRALTQCP